MARIVTALDFSGTIVDTTQALEDLAVEVFDGYVAETDVRHGYRVSAGRSFREQAYWIFEDLDEDLDAPILESMVVEFHKREWSIVMDADPFPDVAKALFKMRVAGHKLIVITEQDQALVNEWMITRTGHSIDRLYGYDKSKTAWLKELQPDYFIGDSMMDLAFALDAGVTFVGCKRNDYLPSGVGRNLLEIVEAMQWGK